MPEADAPRRHRRARQGRQPRRVGRLAAAALAGLALVAGSAAPAPAGTALSVGRPVLPPQQVGDDGPQLPVRPDADDDLTRDRADDILDGDEYQAPEPGGETIGERLRKWLADRLPSFDGAGPAFEGAAWVVAGVVGIAAVGGLVWILATSARRRRAPEDEEVDASVEVAPLRSPSEWAEEAARCTAAGDHRGAVRAHFRVLTSTLAERRLVADTPGRTAGELRRDVAERVPRTADAFDASATLFEEVWFGDRPAGAPETERAAALTREVLRAAPRRGRTDDDADVDAERAERREGPEGPGGGDAARASGVLPSAGRPGPTTDHRPSGDAPAGDVPTGRPDPGREAPPSSPSGGEPA